MVKPGIALLIRVCFSAKIADRFALACAGKLLSENCRTPWTSKSSEIEAFLEMLLFSGAPAFKEILSN